MSEQAKKAIVDAYVDSDDRVLDPTLLEDICRAPAGALQISMGDDWPLRWFSFQTRRRC